MAIKTTYGATRMLADVADDKRFFCQDGRVSKNLNELIDCLKSMAEEVYRHHVTTEKNDFSNWIRDVLGDAGLASKVYSARSSAEAGKMAMERMSSLQSNLQPVISSKPKIIKANLNEKRATK
ncbi:MAG: hypothetical protein A2144_07855 [Chloroflexi bacterium RBG_16_50_9]|nr:MAG: hypothetical protein A2144_07855 [Chloroflexi bacterium RBG_16_50_9]